MQGVKIILNAMEARTSWIEFIEPMDRERSMKLG